MADLDIFFLKHIKEENHRMLITHSAIPCIVIVICALIFSQSYFFLLALSYFSHIIIDTVDWGVNLFYFPKKLFGLKLLISNEEQEKISDILNQYKHNQSFYNFRYYDSTIILLLETLFFSVMLFSISLFALKYIYILLIYIFAFIFHFTYHQRLKKLEFS